MSQMLPTALPYEPPADRGDVAWRALRIGAIVWAAAILVRHATYWTGVVSIVDRNAAIAGAAALFEAVCLVLLLVLLGRGGTFDRLNSGGLLGVSIALIAIPALVLAVDLARQPGLFVTPRGVLRLGWLLATRVQNLVVPIALIVATTARSRVARR